MRTNCVAEPNWKMMQTYRLGAQYRKNQNRFVYVGGTGWFLYLRGEFSIKDGLEAHNSLAGPFHQFDHAKTYLQNFISEQHNQ